MPAAGRKVRFSAGDGCESKGSVHDLVVDVINVGVGVDDGFPQISMSACLSGSEPIASDQLTATADSIPQLRQHSTRTDPNPRNHEQVNLLSTYGRDNGCSRDVTLRTTEDQDVRTKVQTRKEAVRT